MLTTLELKLLKIQKGKIFSCNIQVYINGQYFRYTYKYIEPYVSCKSIPLLLLHFKFQREKSTTVPKSEMLD